MYMYRISLNRMCALYLFQCFDIAHIIRGRFVFEINLIREFHLISYEISNRKQGVNEKWYS